MIVVEGMDNSGKTTLVQQISSRYNLPIQPSLGPPDAEKTLQILSQFLLATDLKIYDRLVAFSDTVYGAVLRKRVVTDPLQWTWIARVIKQEPFIIYCRPPTEKVLDFGDREQMTGVVNRARVLLHRYDQLFDDLEAFFGLGVYIKYDWTNEESAQVLWRTLDHYVEVQRHFRSIINRLDQGAQLS